MSSNPTPKVAFFGATGGCTLSCLTHTLRTGINSVALARTPSKLTSLLKSQGLDDATIAAHLTIVQGNAHDLAAVKQTLTAGGAGSLVDLIVVGLGAAAVLKFSLKAPLQPFTLDDVHVCENAAKTLVTALREISTEQPALKAQQPLVCFISSTGVTRGPEDVPFWMRFLYRHVLAIPHADKKKMENVYRDNVDGKDGNEKVFRNVIGIRPTLLTGSTDVNDGAGVGKVRAGTEKKPAIGYTIKKADVGEWIFKNVVEDTERRRWEGEMVSLTS
jgi:NAD(P)H-binding